MLMLTIPDDAWRSLPISEQELREEIAILLYRKGLPLGKAAGVAGMDRDAFRHLLASRRVPLTYDVADLDHDLEVLRELRGGEEASGK